MSKESKSSKTHFEDDGRPKLAKDDSVVAFIVGGGTLEERCSKCRFFGFDTCRLVEGTIESADICLLFRENVEFSFKDTDLYSITASKKSEDGKATVRAEYAYLAPLDFADVEDGQWIGYLPTPGEFESPRYGTIVITAERNRRFVENFRSAVYQERLPLDAEHETKLSGAVAWVTDMRQNSDGSVDARVDWTDRGRTLMEGDRFKYFSPEFFDEWQDPATGEVYADVAIGGALTTRPFFKENALRPLVATEGGIDAMLGDEDRAHFHRRDQKQEATVTQSAKKKTSIFARMAAALTTSEGGEAVKEDELREELRSELASPQGDGDGGDVKDAEDDDKSKDLESKGSEDGEKLETVATATSERIAATERENKTLREELAAHRVETKELKEEARARRFTEVVEGRTKDSTHRWFGETAANVSMLAELAEKVGEDSSVFKTVVKSHSAQAAQIAFGETLQKERGYQGPGEEPGSVEQKVAAEARKIMSEHPDKYPTAAQARTAVWDSHPEWKAEAHARS